MRKGSNHSLPLLGYTSSTTVMLDLYGIGYEEVMIVAFKAVKDFKLEGFLLAESSKKHYHLVFNRGTSKSRTISIISKICLEKRHVGLTRWFLNQLERGDFTLRISTKEKKSLHLKSFIVTVNRINGSVNICSFEG